VLHLSVVERQVPLDWKIVLAIAVALVLASAAILVSTLGPKKPEQPVVEDHFSDACLIQMPDNSTYNLQTGIPGEEFVATYPNGSQVTFFFNSCPQPVTSSVWPIVTAVEGDPRFLALENGSQYIFAPYSYDGLLHLKLVDGEDVSVSSLIFNLYGDPTSQPSGNLTVLARIEADFAIAYDGVTVFDLNFTLTRGPFPIITG